QGRGAPQIRRKYKKACTNVENRHAAGPTRRCGKSGSRGGTVRLFATSPPPSARWRSIARRRWGEREATTPRELRARRNIRWAGTERKKANGHGVHRRGGGSSSSNKWDS
ncbi:unnamed protein product, partial [Pylaiella littoralis]